MHSHAQHLKWQPITPQTDASFRALSIVDDSVAWVAGTKGWVGTTRDGGKTWKFAQVPGFETLDFRTLYAFDAQAAVIANAGSPANVLRTDDGGRNWKVVYSNVDTAAFIDGVDFWNQQEGVMYGDPIGGQMLLMKTRDGGRSWMMARSGERPVLQKGEASFAASGTNIRCHGKASVVIATGGMVSRLWISENKGTRWRNATPPVLSGRPSRGIFSFSGFKGKLGVVVGGDYLIDTLAVDHAFVTIDGGLSWKAPVVSTRGYRECVEFLTEEILIATGPGGTDISLDGGHTWQPESDEKLYHVVRRARNGRLIIIAGGRGKISVLELP